MLRKGEVYFQHSLEADPGMMSLMSQVSDWYTKANDNTSFGGGNKRKLGYSPETSSKRSRA